MRRCSRNKSLCLLFEAMYALWSLSSGINKGHCWSCECFEGWAWWDSSQSPLWIRGKYLYNPNFLDWLKFHSFNVIFLRFRDVQKIENAVLFEWLMVRCAAHSTQRLMPSLNATQFCACSRHLPLWRLLYSSSICCQWWCSYTSFFKK